MQAINLSSWKEEGDTKGNRETVSFEFSQHGPGQPCYEHSAIWKNRERNVANGKKGQSTRERILRFWSMSKRKRQKGRKSQCFDLSWESESWTFSPTLWFPVGTTYTRRQEFWRGKNCLIKEIIISSTSLI